MGRAHRRSDGGRRRHRSCSVSTPTCPARFRPRSTRRPSPGRRRRPVFPPRRRKPTTSSRSSIRSTWPTRRRWGPARRRCTGSPIHRSAWPPGSSTTMRAASSSSRGSSTEQSEGLTRDDVLDNITLFWLTNTAVSTSRLYWENKFSFFNVKDVAIPVAVSVFPDELYPAPRSWAEKAYIPSSSISTGSTRAGTSPAWEQPELFVEEVRTGFRSLR